RIGHGLFLLNVFRFLLTAGKSSDTLKLNVFKKGADMYIVHSYLTYLIVSMAVTIWVARTLAKNGRAFLVEAFRGNTELADSVNRLLVVGFYLINAGYVAAALETRAPVAHVRQAIE